MPLSSWQELVRRHQRPLASWYADAVIAAVSIAESGEPFSGRAIDLTGLRHGLNDLQSWGITCIRVIPCSELDRGGGEPLFSQVGHTSNMRLELQRLITAAHCRNMRVLVDASARPARNRREWRTQMRAGTDWVHQGADGIVLERPTAGVEATEPPAGPGTWFISVGGTPVPLGIPRTDLTELALFRASLLDTLLESIRRESSIALLGLMIRLALSIVRRPEDRCSFLLDGRVDDARIGGVVPFAHYVDDHPARTQLIRRLLFSLPGPPQVVFPADVNLPEATAWDAVHGDVSAAWDDLAALIELRAQSDALRWGTASPVSGGGGPSVAFVREWRGDVVLVAANLSARPAEVECDLAGYQGREVVDMIDPKRFVGASGAEYVLSLPPYGCQWLRLGVADSCCVA